ncbi:MAG: GNAT family N-acetyltransferase [Burkholderiaceae bacterium]|nr:GNAT family N-acetyltransferase [Burkholderiaceae bacterium]
MKWPTTSELSRLVPLPEGYCFAELDRKMLPTLISAIRVWHPAISTGVASCYLREDFYHRRVVLDGENDRDIIAVPFTSAGQLAGMWSFEREIDSLAIYGRLIVVAPEHRGARLAAAAMKGTEDLGRAMGAAFLYAMATLKIPQAQRALESAGYRLLGFFPGYDREEVSPGVVKRVYEAVYAKLLVPEEEVLRPDPRNLTPRSRALYALLFTD